MKKVMALKKAALKNDMQFSLFKIPDFEKKTSCHLLKFSWAEGQLGCWEEHHPGQ